MLLRERLDAKLGACVVGLLALLGCASAAVAVENSLLQMKLVNSATFQARVQYLAPDYASTVLAEAHNTACHTSRMALAQQVVTGGMAQRLALWIVRSNAGGRVILGTMVDDANPALVDSSASDLALAAAIVFYWNDAAGCDGGT